MFCPKCGTQQPDDEGKFCLNCGAPLTGPRQAGAHELKPQDAEETQVIDAAGAGTETAVIEGAAPQADPTAQMPPAAGAPTQQMPPATPPEQTQVYEPPVAPAPAAAPVAAAPRPQQPKQRNNKLIAIIAAIVVVAVVVVLLVVFVFKPGQAPTGSDNQQPPQQTSPAPTGTEDTGKPTDTGTPTDTSGDHNSMFVGSWVLVSSTYSGITNDDIATLEEQGVYITIDLEADGTGVWDMIDNKMDLTWTGGSDGTGAITASNGSMEMRLAGGNLVLVNANGDTMTYAAAGSSGGSGKGGGTSTSGSMQTMGNKYVGTIEVPASWEDMTSALSKELQEDYAASYFVDPSSSFSSKALGSTAYAKAIQMTGEMGDYKTLSSNFVKGAQGMSDTYTNITQESGSIGGHDAVVVTMLLAGDNLQLCTVFIDIDGSSTAIVTMNCGTTQEDAEEVLSYAKEWTY